MPGKSSDGAPLCPSGNACLPESVAETNKHEGRDMAASYSPSFEQPRSSTALAGDSKSLDGVVDSSPGRDVSHPDPVDRAGDTGSLTEADRVHPTDTTRKSRARTSREQLHAYAAKHTALSPPSTCADGRYQNNCCVQVQVPKSTDFINIEVNRMSAEARREWFRGHVHDHEVTW